MTDSAWTWENETIQEGTVETVVPGDGPYLEVVSEVPLTKAGERLPRCGNRYYPTMVRVWWGEWRDTDGEPEKLTHLLLAEDARTIGAALIKAAGAAESTDAQDTDPCGHWHPCECIA